MDRTEQAILRRIDENRNALLSFADDLLHTPELSDQEHKTARRVADALAALGLPVKEGLSGTGVLAEIGNARPRVVLIGELDAIRCPGHPHADPVTGAAHACGHHAQLTAVLGAAMALTAPEVREALDGGVSFFAVPAEEMFGGKVRLLADGTFDGMDAAVTHHTHYMPTEEKLMLGSVPSSGVIVKRAVFTGKAAHAAGAPHEGVNALSAASLALSAVGYLREGFREGDGIRAHGVITEGGAVHNVIPNRAVLSYAVRAMNPDALGGVSRKINRAFEGSAMALGAGVTVEDLFAYQPMPYRAAEAFQREIAAMLLPGEPVAEALPGMINPVSSDVGDLMRRMPVINFTTGGFSGPLHSAEYRMDDPDTALLLPARVMALTAYRLLRDGAKELRRICTSF